jgi:hypothetical protein
VPSLLRPRTVLPEAGQCAIDEPRIERGQFRIARADAVRDTGAEALHEHVRGLHQRMERGSALCRLEVERDVGLAAGEFGDDAARPAAAYHDHFGAEVGEQHGAIGARREPREVHDPDAGERSARSWGDGRRHHSPLAMTIRCTSLVPS